MNRIKCPNGHIYDQDQSPICPICAGNQLNKNSRPGTRIVNSVNTFYSSLDSQKPVFNAPTNEHNSSDSYFSYQNLDPYSGTRTRKVNEQNVENMWKNNNEVKPASASVKNSGDRKTKIFNGKSFSTRPPMGWLVCVMGDDKGKSFEIPLGKATIGRSGEKKYDIDLSDKHISRAHPIGTIFYISDQYRFLFTTDPSGNLVPYIDGAPVLSTALLQDYDDLRIGNTVLLFRAFCSYNVNWDKFEGQATL